MTQMPNQTDFYFISVDDWKCGKNDKQASFNVYIYDAETEGPGP